MGVGGSFEFVLVNHLMDWEENMLVSSGLYNAKIQTRKLNDK